MKEFFCFDRNRNLPGASTNMAMEVTGASSADGAEVQIWSYYDSESQMKWVFEEASSVGSSIPANYELNDSYDVRCYPFALYLNIPLNVAGYTPGDSLSKTKDLVLQQFNAKDHPYNRSVRPISKNANIIKDKEFKIAMAVSSKDYHFMVQCADGTWAHKLAYLNSKNLGNIDPDNLPWDYSGVDPSTGKEESAKYTEGTVYFAVRIWE